MNARTASRYIAAPDGWNKVMYQNGDVKDIITVILKADSLSPKYTRELANQLRQDDEYDTMRAIWQFVKDNVHYVRDKVGHEVVQLPGALWRGRKGDCKSFSIFEGSLLKNLGFKYRYRVAFYDPANPDSGHIYPVATLSDGTEVVLDAVHNRFDEEVRFWKARDYYPASGYSRKAQRLNGLSPEFWQKFTASLQTDEFWIGVGQRVAQGVIVYIAFDLFLKPLLNKRARRNAERLPL